MFSEIDGAVDGFTGRGVGDVSPTSVRRARPPRGWNSFDGYGLHFHEDVAMATIDVQAGTLAAGGYDHFVIDGGWYNEYDHVPGTRLPLRKSARDVNLDAFGRYLPSRSNFPGGLERIAAYATERGLIPGIHIMRGIPRKAVELDLPVRGTGTTAQQIADPSSVCQWSTLNYGINMRAPGAQEYYDGWVELLAGWGFRFIKADDITAHAAEIEAVATAIERAGVDIGLSLSPGGDTDERHRESYGRADMVRVTRDVWDNGADIDAVFAAWEHWADRQIANCWIDLDMLPIGELLVPFGTQDDGVVAELHGRGAHRTSSLSPGEQRVVITMRALAASPLFLGADLLSSGQDVIDLVTNPDVLACHDSGAMGVLLDRRGHIEMWSCNTDLRRWVGVFNRGDSPAHVKFADVGAIGEIHEAWGHPRGHDTVDVPPHDVALLSMGWV
jgi:alpha-galactosidase